MLHNASHATEIRRPRKMVFCQKKYMYIYLLCTYIMSVGCIGGWVGRASFVVAGRDECRATPSKQACQMMAGGQEEHASDRHCVYTRVSFIPYSLNRNCITYFLLFIAVNLNCNVRGCQAAYRLHTHFGSSPALSMCTHSHSEQVDALNVWKHTYKANASMLALSHRRSLVLALFWGFL